MIEQIIDEYISAVKIYGSEHENWQREREKTICSVENTIKAV